MKAAPGTSGPRLAVAQIVDTLDTGGAEHLAINFANQLAERGHRSHIYVIGHTGPLAAAISGNVGVDVLEFRRNSIENPLKFSASISDGFRRLRFLIKRDGIELVQTHLPSPNFWGLALSLGRACVCIATIHNNKEFSYGSNNSLKEGLRHAAYRTIVRHCAASVAVSDMVRTSFLGEIGLREDQAARLLSIPNGVEIPEWAPPMEKLAAKKRLGFDTGPLLGIAVGRVCEQKNFQDLIPVMSELKGMNVPIQFVIAGDGPEMPDLLKRRAEAGLEREIKTLGNVTNIPEYLKAADFFLMPSLWEGLPLALLEAMAAGLPVVGYAIDGLTDVIEEGQTGYLVPFGDRTAMAQRILGLAQDPDLRLSLGSKGRDVAKERFNLQRVVDDIERLYFSVLARQQG